MSSALYSVIIFIRRGVTVSHLNILVQFYKLKNKNCFRADICQLRHVFRKVEKETDKCTQLDG